MVSRVQAGMAIAAFPFGLGVVLFSGHRREAAMLFGFAFLVVLLTLANRLPALHRIPGVGAPKLKLAGRQIPQSVHSRKNEVLIEVLVVTPTRLEDAGLRLTYPDTVELRPFDAQGKPLEGTMIPPFEPGSGTSQWVLHRVLPLGASPFRFVLEGSGATPFNFTVLVEVQSEKLYRNVEAFDFAVTYP